MKTFIKRTLTVAALTTVLGGTAIAATSQGPTLMRHQWSWEGLFGGYDQDQLQRGWEVYSQVCSACHPVTFLRYRDLEKIGFSQEKVEELAAAAEQVQDGFDETGEPAMRARIPADPIQRPYPNDEAAKAANGGALPPDLSMITKARKGGANYVYGIQTGYPDEYQGVTPQWWIDANTDPKTGELLAEFPQDKYFNNFFPGNAINMPPQHVDGVVYADGTSPTQEQGLKDVITFLNWASDPSLEERKTLGLRVLLFLGLLSAFLYALKSYVWRDVEH